MKTKHELLIIASNLCYLAHYLQLAKQYFPVNSFNRMFINQEICLINWQVRELAKLTGTKCIV
jgi:hypothetical protein